MMTQEPRRKSTRRVHFSPYETVRFVKFSSSTSLEEYRTRWYLESELDAFKTESRHACTRLGESGPENVVDLTNKEANSDYCLRGLEVRMSPERQKNRTLAIRAILAAQHRFRDPEILAVAARRCTAWAKEIARNTALLDYYQVYLPDHEAATKQPPMPSVLCPLSFLRKRLQEKDDDVERRVRPCNGPVVAR